MAATRVILLRHGPREGAEDAITAEGEAQAWALGEKYRAQFPDVAPTGICSGKARAHQTLMAILAGMGLVSPSPRIELALQNEVSPGFDATWLRLEANDPAAGVDMYLDFGRHRPDPDTLSPWEAAERVAKLICECLPPSGQTGAPDDSLILMVTHSGITELFLAALLQFDSVSAIGGILDYLEPVSLTFEVGSVASGAEMSPIVSLRGREYVIDTRLWREVAGERS
jgi:broad specificity phosphatase PhoE